MKPIIEVNHGSKDITKDSAQDLLVLDQINLVH